MDDARRGRKRRRKEILEKGEKRKGIGAKIENMTKGKEKENAQIKRKKQGKRRKDPKEDKKVQKKRESFIYEDKK